jgi:hypothetical protein
MKLKNGGWVGLSDYLYMQEGEEPETYIMHTYTVPRCHMKPLTWQLYFDRFLLTGSCDVVNHKSPQTI